MSRSEPIKPVSGFASGTDTIARTSILENFISVIRSAPIVPDLPMSDPDIRRIVEDFVDRLREDIAELQKLASAGDFAAIAGIAHRLKGTAGTLGFPDFYEPSMKLEFAARDGDASDVGNYVSVLAGLVARILIPSA